MNTGGLPFEGGGGRFVNHAMGMRKAAADMALAGHAHIHPRQCCREQHPNYNATIASPFDPAGRMNSKSAQSCTLDTDRDSLAWSSILSALH